MRYNHFDMLIPKKIEHLSMLTLDLKEAEDYRKSFYAYLASLGWKKREEADTAWTQTVSIEDQSDKKKALEPDVCDELIEYLKTNWRQHFGELPEQMEVTGIMQVGDIGYFAVHFSKNSKAQECQVTIKRA